MSVRPGRFLPGRLPPDRPPLDADRLRDRLLRPGSLWRRIDVVESTGSTNADLAAAAAEGAVEGTVLLAEEQVSGRGRLERRWQAPPRSSLAVSVLLRPPVAAPGGWGWLPLLVGLAAAEAVVGQTAMAVSVKWPNDVLLAEGKLAGVLAERITTPDGPAAVVGVGLNVSQRPGELPVATAVSLETAGAAHVDRTLLAVALLERVAERYRGWQLDPAGLRTDYLATSATVGRRVTAHLPGGRDVTGLAADVDDVGRLLVDARGTRTAVAAADVVHLRGDGS